MRQTVIFRLLALLFLFPAGLAAPGAALAHGVAQHRAHAAHQRHAARELSDAVDAGWTIERAACGTRDARDCDHPRFYRAIRSRVTAPSFTLLTAPPALPVVQLLNARSGPSVCRASPPRAELETGPPPSLRAPPLG